MFTNSMRPRFQRFASFNYQGINYKIKQTHIADDFYKFHLAAIIVQEPPIKETGLHKKRFVYIIQAIEQNRSEESG